MRNASALISSASTRASFHPTHTHTHTHSHITPNFAISTTQYKNYIPVSPPANMANACSGSDVAAISNLATLRVAVVQRPLVALNMSTALLTTPDPEQRISAHLQRHKARLFPPNTHTHPLPHHTISQYQQFNSKITYLIFRLRIRPILAQAVTSLQDNILPR